jgi:uncharacterized membrane protein
MELNFVGVIVGVISFLLIGVLHPVVIKSEYHIGTRVWPAFLIVGLACVIASILVNNFMVSAILAVAGFSFLWGIKELFDQQKRVEKGWFPANPKKKDDADER